MYGICNGTKTYDDPPELEAVTAGEDAGQAGAGSSGLSGSEWSGPASIR